MHRIRFVAFAAAIALIASGCSMLTQASVNESQSPNTRPWWCTATHWEKVTGPGMGTTDWYAGQSKGDLSWPDCKAVSDDLDKAEAFVEKYPTAGAAEAAGYRKMTNYVGGMGTHHALNWLTPAQLNSPTFDRFNPTFPGTEIDDVFDPTHPEVLQYDGNGPDAKLTGFDWYVHTSNGLPPEGLPGNNDWWHHHPIICASKATAAMVGVNTTEAQCTAQGGLNIYLQNYYMLHAWVKLDLPWKQDVFAGMNPCIVNGGAIRDLADPCHNEMESMASMDAKSLENTEGVHATMDHSDMAGM